MTQLSRDFMLLQHLQLPMTQRVALLQRLRVLQQLLVLLLHRPRGFGCHGHPTYFTTHGMKMNGSAMESGAEPQELNCMLIPKNICYLDFFSLFFLIIRRPSNPMSMIMVPYFPKYNNNGHFGALPISKNIYTFPDWDLGN